MIVLITIAFFAACMGAMAIGVLFSDRALRGSCGGPDVHDADGDAISCGACPRKEADVCPSDDELVRIARAAYPGASGHH